MPVTRPRPHNPAQPHYFVCYSHRDRNAVFSELVNLQKVGLNFWFDDGMDPGSEWPDELAAAISECKALLFFVSPDSVATHNCRSELQYARDHRKPIIAVYLQETVLPPAVQLILSTTHALNRYSLDPDTYRAQLIKVLDERSDPEPGSKRLPMRSLSPRQRERLTWSLALLVLISAIVYLSRIVPEAPPRPETRFSIEIPPDLDITPATFYEMFVPPPLAISPDGQRIVFSARDDAGQPALYLRSMTRFDTRLLEGTEGGTSPFFSPDGNWVGFESGRALRKVSLESGAVETITTLDAGPGYGGASWGSDDRIVFAPSAVGGLFVVPANGGTPQRLSSPDAGEGELGHVMPQWMPGQNTVLMSVRMGLAPDAPVIKALDLTDGSTTLLLEGAMGGRYRNGKLIYGGTANSAESLWAAPFSLSDRHVDQPGARLIEAVSADLYALPYYDVSRTGTVAYVPASAEQPLDVLAWLDAEGNERVIAESKDNIVIPAIAPDEQTISMTIVDEATRGMDLWLLNTGRSSMVKWNSGGHNAHAAVWTPDGKQLVFTSDHDGPSNLYMKPVDLTGAPRRLTDTPRHQDAGAFSPDGNLLTYAELHPQTNWDVWVLDLRTLETRALLATDAEEMQPIVSPDGSSYAYTSNETGRREVYLENFPRGGGKQRVSTAGGEDPVWSRDGSQLHFRLRDSIYSVAVASGRVVDDPKRILQGRYEGRTGYGKANWDLSMQGRILVTTRQPVSLAPRINVIVDWSLD